VLGPDATGAGWVYEYVLVDHSHKQNLADLRSLQDWYIRYQLETVPGVAEVATIGGYVRQYQVRLDPENSRRLIFRFQRLSTVSAQAPAKSADACWNSAARNTWCAASVTSNRSMTLATYPWVHITACP